MTQIIATQAALFEKARRDRGAKFNRLLREIDQPDRIAAAVQEVLREPGSRTPGIDNKTRADYQSPEDRQALVATVHDFLEGYYYLPEALRPVQIPKRGKSGWRTILVPILRDRVIDHQVEGVIAPICEADFLPISTGYRPKKSRMDVIVACRRFVTADRLWVYRADVRDCLPSIEKDRVIDVLGKRITDQRILDMVWAFLDARACDRGFHIELAPGVPVGLSLSPLLMNVFLHQLDLWWQTNLNPRRLTSRGLPNARYVRYADDLTFFIPGSECDAAAIQAALTEFLATKLHLDLSKSVIRRASDGFDLLGFHLVWVTDGRGHLAIRASDRRVDRFKEVIAETLNNGNDAVDIIQDVNQESMTFAKEFRYVDSREQFRALDHWIGRKLKEQFGSQFVVDLITEERTAMTNRFPALKRLSGIKREEYRPFSGNPFRPQ